VPSIVIVDDRITNRRILSRLASELDSKPEVETFGDPMLALGWLERNEPDLVVTDFKMPNLDGAEFVQSLRRLPTCSDVPVIVVTAYEDRGFRYEALNAGATDFLLSPVDHEEFRARARNLLTLRFQQSLLKRRAEQLQDKLEQSNRLHKVALKDSNEKLRLVMNTIPAMISATNAEHRYVFMNNFQAWMLGIDPDEVVDCGAEDFMGEDSAARNRRLDRQVFETGATIPAYEEEFFDATGRGRTLLTTKSPLRDSTGAVVNVVTASVEISDRKAAELALEEQRAFLRNVIDHDPNIIFATDKNGVLTLANRALAELCAFSPEQVIGQELIATAPLRAEAEILTADVQRILNGETRKFATERCLTDRLGQAHWYHVVNLAFEQGFDKSPAVLTVATEMAVVKRPAETPERRGPLNQELLTPLNAIIRYCETISGGAPDSGPSPSEMAEEIGSNARRLLGLVDGLVDISNFRDSESALDNDEIDLAALVQKLAGEAGMEIALDIAPYLPALIADPARLPQGLQNLLSSAAEYAAGHLALSVGLSEAGALRLSLSGPAQSDEAQENPLLFADLSSSGLDANDPGAEIGVPLWVSFMKMHGAEIEISRHDGMHLTITFPAMRSAWRQMTTTQ
jgi:PAS domain S-box-containing protein